MLTKVIYVFLLLVFGGSTVSNAAVLNSSTNGFVIESSVKVDSAPKRSYQQFLRINEWWDAEHSWFGSADNFSISAQVGGCFCEIDGERQVEHMRVAYIEPNEEIRLLGGLGPLQMMGVHGAMTWKFLPLNNGGTEIVHRYAVSGYLDSGLDKLAEVVDRVQTSQLQRLSDRLSGASLQEQ